MHVIETERLILRTFTRDDLDRLADLFADRQFCRFSVNPNGIARDDAAIVLGKILGWTQIGLPPQFAVILRESGTLIGYCGFWPQEIDGERVTEIGYRLNPQFWNRGIATEAARAVRDHAFRDLQLEHVVSFIHPDNHPSRRVVEKIGMHFEKHTTFHGFPTDVFGIARGEWIGSE